MVTGAQTPNNTTSPHSDGPRIKSPARVKVIWGDRFRLPPSLLKAIGQEAIFWFFGHHYEGQQRPNKGSVHEIFFSFFAVLGGTQIRSRLRFVFLSVFVAERRLVVGGPHKSHNVRKQAKEPALRRNVTNPRPIPNFNGRIKQTPSIWKLGIVNCVSASGAPLKRKVTLGRIYGIAPWSEAAFESPMKRKRPTCQSHCR